MISPADYGEAIAALRFMVAPIKMGSGQAGRECQLTIVEIVVDKIVDREIDISFCVPGVAMDMSGLVSAMGQTPVDEAMDCWDKRVEGITMMQSYTKPVEFSTADPVLQKLSGMQYLATVTIPNGPCVVTAAWEHDYCIKAGHKMVMIPTQNEHLRSWRMEGIVLGADTSPYGKVAKRPLSRNLRWDLAAQANISFPDLNTATYITQHSGALPFHNLYFPMERRLATDREYVSVCGSVIRDETSQGLVTFYDVGFQPLFSVCGAIVRDGFNFQNAHVPFTVTERMCRILGPLVIKDISPGDSLISCTIGDKILYINTLKREKYGGVNWVAVTK